MQEARRSIWHLEEQVKTKKHENEADVWLLSMEYGRNQTSLCMTGNILDQPIVTQASSAPYVARMYVLTLAT